MLSAAVQEQGTEMEDRFMFHKNMDMKWLVSKLKFIFLEMSKLCAADFTCLVSIRS